MAHTERPQVSKSNTTIKKILARTVGASWKGRKVVVLEAARGWYHTQYIDDQVHIWHLNLASMSARPAEKPRYGGPSLTFTIGDRGEALVIHERFMGKDVGVEIVVLADDIDANTVQVATDSLLEHNKSRATQACDQCGVTSGICMALAEAHADSRVKDARNVGTKKKTPAQLQREIDAVLGRR